MLLNEDVQEDSFMSRNLVCNECGGNMQEGLVIEKYGAFGQIRDATYWLEGRLQKDIFGVRGVVKTKGMKADDIKAYRCERCGFLKFYAGSDHSSEK